jgi:phosphonate dehydrogenase
MEKPIVNITHWVHQPIIDYLSDCGYQVLVNPSKDSLIRDELMARSAQAQAIMMFMPDSVDENFLRACPRLRIVAGALKGYDNFDVEACSRHGVWFSNVPDLLTIPTAELALGILLIMARRLQQADQMVRSGAFKGWRPVLYSQGIFQQTVGIIGLGQLGQTTAKLLQAFGPRLLGYDPLPLSPSQQEMLRLSQTELSHLLAESHYVLVLAPLSAESYHMINRQTIAAMRPGAYLINLGRGSVVDEADVADALHTGHLAGYGADVFAFEDWALHERPQTINGRLLGMPDKTFFTPHIGSGTEQARQAIAMEAAYNIHDALRGQRPRNAVNLL